MGSDLERGRYIGRWLVGEAKDGEEKKLKQGRLVRPELGMLGSLPGVAVRDLSPHADGNEDAGSPHDDGRCGAYEAWSRGGDA